MAEQFSSLSWHFRVASISCIFLISSPYINVNIIVYILRCSCIVTLIIMRQCVLESLVSVSILLYVHWLMC